MRHPARRAITSCIDGTRTTMKTKGFKYYSTYGLIWFFVCVSGWLYIDYKDHMKWSRWLRMTESALYYPIKVKLTRIVEIEETSSVSYSSSGSRQHTQTTTHSQGWVVDKKGKRYKIWIGGGKRSELKIGNTYNLFDLDGVNIIPDFVKKRSQSYAVSSSGVAGVVIISIAFSLYFVAIYFGIKSNRKI